MQVQLLFVFGAETGQHAVENVVVSLVRALSHDSGLLQQVLLDFRPFDHTVVAEVDVDVLAETGRVVVSDRFGISEGCRNTSPYED